MPKTQSFTVRQLFLRAAALHSYSGEELRDLEPFVPAWLDGLLQEALPYENARRVFEALPARPALQSAPAPAAMEDEVPYDDEICRTALVWGLAAQLALDEGDALRAGEWRLRCLAALRDTERLKDGEVRDCYA